MERIIELGKIDYLKIGKKINLVTLEIELRNDEKNRPVFSVCGNVWDNRKKDILIGGQCLDELFPYFKNNELFVKIYKLWKKHHLNNLHSGTKKQEKFLIKNNIQNWANDYKKVCEFLNKNNLLYDKGIEFGATWHYWDIPKKDLEEIIKIIEEEY